MSWQGWRKWEARSSAIQGWCEEEIDWQWILNLGNLGRPMEQFRRAACQLREPSKFPTLSTTSLNIVQLTKICTTHVSELISSKKTCSFNVCFIVSTQAQCAAATTYIGINIFLSYVCSSLVLSFQLFCISLLHLGEVLKQTAIKEAPHRLFWQASILVPSKYIDKAPLPLAYNPAHKPGRVVHKNYNRTTWAYKFSSKHNYIPTNEVKCYSVSFSHVPQLLQCKLVRVSSCMLAKHVLKICRHVPERFSNQFSYCIQCTTKMWFWITIDAMHAYLPSVS